MIIHTRKVFVWVGPYSVFLDVHSCTGLVSSDTISRVVTKFYLSSRSPLTFEVVFPGLGGFTCVPLGHHQTLPYGCSFVTYEHPGGSAAGDITIIWNDVLK